MAVENDIGFSSTITASSSFFTGVLRDVTLDLGERSAVDSSHMTTTNGWRTFIPGDLKDPGTLTCDVLFNPGNLTGWKTILSSTRETFTFTSPSAGTSSATYACSGFAIGGSIAIPMDDMMAGTITIKFTGEPTVTNGTT